MSADEIRRLQEETIPHIAMLAYSVGRLASMPGEAEVDTFQLELEAAVWWGRMEGKARELDR